MNKFVLFSFLILGVGFYELSGGSDFVPQTREAATVQVARAESIEAVTPALREIAPEPEKVATVIAEPTENTIQLAALNVQTSVSDLPKIDLSKFDIPQAVAPVTETSVTSEEPTGFIGTDIRQVTGTRVNIRSGPGTSYDVVAQAIQGDEAEIIVDDGTGWVQLRLAGGQTGWMADFLLSN